MVFSFLTFFSTFMADGFAFAFPFPFNGEATRQWKNVYVKCKYAYVYTDV